MGLLQKRVKEHFPVGNGFSEYHNRGNQGERWFFLEIVEEMRQEFPSLEDCYEDVICLEEQVAEVKKWQKKWLEEDKEDE